MTIAETVLGITEMITTTTLRMINLKIIIAS